MIGDPDAAPIRTAADSHRPVLLLESVDALSLRPEGCYVDATFGRGGHARAILAALGPTGRLVAFDRDPDAALAARALDDPRFGFVQRPFGELAEGLRSLAVEAVDGALFDLGVSSPQIEDPRRGFSFRLDGPLDMRMDPGHGVPASRWLASASERDLRRVIADYGEERAAARIARTIVAERARAPIDTTRRLAAVVAGAVGRAHGGRRPDIDPATRTFQALRIHVNDELGQIARALEQVVDFLRPGARLVVISFHSLEDRIVKRFIRERAGRGTVDPRLARLPSAPGEPVPMLREVGRLVRPSAEECADNPRARSARMRVAERLASAAAVKSYDRRAPRQ